MTRNKLRRAILVAAAICFFCVPSVANEDSAADIKVELSSQKPLWLHITIRSRATTRITFYKWRLPWGNLNSMKLVAVTPRENYLKIAYPIDDP